VPAPPAETSDQTTAELGPNCAAAAGALAMTNTAIQYYNAVRPRQRWHDPRLGARRAEKQSPNRQARLATILHTALHRRG